MTQHDPRIYLTHMLESIELVESYVEGADLTSFSEDQEKQDAVVRRIEIMGEAVKNLPADLRAAHPDVPWTQIAGMRDKVIHDIRLRISKRGPDGLRARRSSRRSIGRPRVPV